ncbi:hypothetical protein DL96DRAFT_474935 [Flagelloscypha sp. PMI_526]|nr:hypothetical protein DL96DRAFT_474935 [Flagelloscypha sp. PMI_526]
MKPQAPCQNPACFKPPPAGSKWPACSGCGRTFYCSKKCQKEHWKSHKSLCQMNQKTVNKIEGVKYSPPGGGDSSKAEVGDLLASLRN